MRWKPGQKEATRRHILDAAGAMFRERGYAKTSVADLMGQAGLTVGGFYAHFESKDRLLGEILGGAFERTRDGLFRGLEGVSGNAFVREVTRRYLSQRHRDDVADGCPLPPLAAEVGREGDGPRAEIEGYMLAIAALLEKKGPVSPAGLTAKQLALALTAMSVGGLLLARAVRDESLSNAILEACRRLAAASVEP